MVILNNVAFMGAASSRSRIYLQQMIKHGLVPGFAVLLCPDKGADPGMKAGVPDRVLRHAADQGFDLEADIKKLVNDAGIPHRIMPTENPNDQEVVAAVDAMEQKVVIYSGPGGAILRKPLLDTGRNFLHVHPGLVPEYRGSTTVYYSLLNENSLGASAIFLEEKIDAGPVLMRRKFPPPVDRTLIDHFHDPYIRSEVLLDMLRAYAEGREPLPERQAPKDGETYYIIHPVLKHLAMLSEE